MAISIPIFTSQLRKARLATNQANARAAYAAATTHFMLDYAEKGAGGAVSYTYTVSKGMIETDEVDKETATTGLGKSVTVDISSWGVDSEIDSKKLGDYTAKKWAVILDKNGSVTGYAAIYE